MDRKVMSHVGAALLAIAFVVAGGLKVAGSPRIAADFAEWHFPMWFMLIAGLYELTCGILVLIPKIRFFGASLLLAEMVGATATHAIHGAAGFALITLLVGFLALGVAWITWPPPIVADGPSSG